MWCSTANAWANEKGRSGDGAPLFLWVEAGSPRKGDSKRCAELATKGFLVPFFKKELLPYFLTNARRGAIARDSATIPSNVARYAANCNLLGRSV
jgi:hypothetical protein